MEMTVLIEESKRHKLLRAIRDGRLEIAEPALEDDGKVKYQAVEDLVGGPADEVELALFELSRSGVLRSEVFEEVMVCPACGSHKFSVEVRCPSCESPKLERIAMVEHLPCGHVDRMENFLAVERLVCPKCNRVLRKFGTDYRKLGVIYRCSSCGDSFAEPKKRFMCDGEHVFEEDELTLRELKSFRVNAERKALVELEAIDFTQLLGEVTRMGWLGRSPAVIRGRTGIEHEFKLAIWKGAADITKEPPYIVVDAVGHEDELSANDVLAFRAKSQDVVSKENILVGIKADQKGKLFAKSYGIYIVEGERTRDFEEQTRNILFNLLKKEEKIKAPAGGLETVLSQLDQEIRRAEIGKEAGTWVCSKCKAANPEERAYCFNCGAMRTQPRWDASLPDLR